MCVLVETPLGARSLELLICSSDLHGLEQATKAHLAQKDQVIAQNAQVIAQKDAEHQVCSYVSFWVIHFFW
eukprot:m.61256 g.61256  ORF g.61256 m.61256 type:complete len:71 (+) comp49431_c1_seq5:326-538(+)